MAFVDPRNTSKTCSKCGHYSKSSRKSQAVFKCVSCGFELNADLNAARNIAARAAANHAVRACPVRKGERGTPDGSRPPANQTGPVQADLESSCVGKPSPTSDGGYHDDALVLQVHGGYGMYIDILTRDEADRLRFVLCKECADRLVAANPFMGRVFGYCRLT